MTGYSSETRAGIIVTRRHAQYKDQPGLLYHYPKKAYDRPVRALEGCLTLVYEPRRGGTSKVSASGGRRAFVGFAYLGDRWDDPDDPTHAFVKLVGYGELASPVPISSTPINGTSLQHAVREIPMTVAEAIIRSGMSALTTRSPQVHEGYADVDIPEAFLQRPIREMIASRAVRDATFRLRVVEQVYQGRCALTGVRMTNGHGRAEADAAHIIPVSAGGPDSVRNGIALMKSLHWAFDRGLVSLSDEGKILAVDRGLEAPVHRLLAADGHAFLPADVEDRPHPAFLRWHREHVFKGAA